MNSKTQVISRYGIDFKGLSEGEHHFDFVADRSLFGIYEGCELLGGECKCSVALIKSEVMLHLSIEIDGEVEVECDRCLDICSIPINYQGVLVVRFTDDQALVDEYDGEVMWLTSAVDTLDLAQYIYESIVLTLPYQRVHQEISQCNQDVVGYLVDNEPEQIEAQEELTSLDQSEIEKLKELKEKLLKK